MKGFISQVTVHVCMLSHFSCVQLFVALWTIVHQAPLSMVFSKQEYWSGLLFTPPGDLPNTEIEPACPMSPALAGVFFTISATWEAPLLLVSYPKNNCQTKVKEIFPYVFFL